MTKQYAVNVNFNEQQCVLTGDTFELKWIHSVEKQWWVEAYQLQNDQLLLTDTYFETFGAGTPSTESSQGVNATSNSLIALESQHQQLLDEQYQGYVHYRINTQLPYLNWMISSNIKAVIINQGVTLPIYQWVDDYSNIYIVPTQYSLWTLFFEETCHGYIPR